MAERQEVVRGTVRHDEDLGGSMNLIYCPDIEPETNVAILPINEETGAVGPIKPLMVQFLSDLPGMFAIPDSGVKRGIKEIATALSRILGGQDE